MKINISQNIINQLGKEGSVSLPRIGSFTIERQDASFTQNRSSILPPNYQLIYSIIQHEIDGLIKEISISNGISKKESKHVLDNYVNELEKSLQENGFVYVHRLGTLKEFHDIRSFDQSEDSIFGNLNYHLPEVNLSPIVREVEEKTALIEKIIAPVPKLKSIENVESIAVPNMVDTNRIETKNEPLKPIVSSPSSSLEVANESNNWFNWKDWLIAALIALLIICCYKSCIPNEPSNTPDKTEWTDVKGNDSIVNSENLVAEINDEIDIHSTNSDSIIPVKCIIITGSFKKSRNALKMQDKIAKLGYTSYMERNGSYNRVGIEFECTNIDLVEYIGGIRKTFNVESWYLVPELVVPR